MRGGGFLLKYLSLNPQIKIDKLILVAPWLDLDKEGGEFLDGFDLDKNLVDQCNEISLFCSTDDDSYIIDSVKKIREIYQNIKIYEFTDKGHFCMDEIGPTFPELLDVIV